MNEKIQQFFDACQPFGYPLLACSVILMAAIAYHLLFTGSNRSLKRLSREFDRLRRGEATAEDMLHCAQEGRTALDREALYVIRHKEDANLVPQVESRLRLLVDSERTGMASISIIANIAPMLGILGTAWGLVDIFGVFGSPEAQEGIALGISKALYTTIFGLAIAVPGIIALACFERALEQRAARINNFFISLLACRHQL